MNQPVTVPGTLMPDGSLVLDDKPKMSPGRVRITLVPEPEQTEKRDDLATILQRIWKDREARGAVPRSKEEVDRDIETLREELEEHANAIEGLQDEAKRFHK